MSFTVAALLVGLAAVASAAQVSYRPTVSDSSEHSSNGYQYYTYYNHHVKYVYTYETCSSPPSSIEICLSSVFSSMEGALSKVAASLKAHEATIKVQMHHEHTLLSSEVSWVQVVSKIAESVKSAVDVDYEGVAEQVADLQDEEQIIVQAYNALNAQLNELAAEARDIQVQKGALYAKYKSVHVAKWSMYKAISAIVYEKALVQEEEAEVENVVNRLNAAMQEIAGKVAQLNKRQQWLNSWEEKLYVDIESFQDDVKSFRAIESSLEDREVSLYAEQGRILNEVAAVQAAMGKLKAEYSSVVEELMHLEGYQHDLEYIQDSVSHEANVFISAYEEFTCEDSLLYYEACSSPSVPAAAPAAAKAAAPAKAVAAAAAKAPAKAAASKASSKASSKAASKAVV